MRERFLRQWVRPAFLIRRGSSRGTASERRRSDIDTPFCFFGYLFAIPVEGGAPTVRRSGDRAACWGIDAVAKYSETLTDHVLTPRHRGVMDAPDLTGHARAPGRGAFLILFLKVRDGRIVAAKYHTLGCGPTIASGSMLTAMIAGRTVAECRELTVDDVVGALDGVPPDKLHCPALAIGALQDALNHGF